MNKGFVSIAVISSGIAVIILVGISAFYYSRPKNTSPQTEVKHELSAEIEKTEKVLQLPKPQDKKSEPTKSSTAIQPPINQKPSWLNFNFFPTEHRETYEFPTEGERAKLPKCSDQMLTKSPVELEKIVSIEPIGSTSPPEHALPSSSTDTYVAVNTRGTTNTVPLYAPGDMWITVIQPRYGITSDPEDHVIHYAFCQDVFGIVDHVKEFSLEMKEIIKNYECKYGGKPGDSKCPIEVLEPVKAGTLLGKVGRMQGNFNFGTWDLRRKNNFINPRRYGIRSLHSTCPFDYYSSPLKEKLTAFLGRKDKQCGTVGHDLAGTAQGEWFYGDAGNRMHGDWFNHLYLGYDNRIPEAAVISAGGVISEPLKWMFVPQTSGTKNVGFQYIKDDRVFCYENTGTGPYWNYEKGPKGKILLQLVDTNSIKIEHRTGACSESESFTTPTIYKR